MVNKPDSWLSIAHFAYLLPYARHQTPMGQSALERSVAILNSL
jgi:hypothetical protein